MATTENKVAQAPNDISSIEAARPVTSVQPGEDLKNPVNVIDQQYGVTQRGLKSRHVQLMVIGGSIGVGLWVRPLSFSHSPIPSGIEICR